jgi:hypothetical protein
MNRAIRFYRSSVGKKVVMAVTGVIGIGFLIIHVLGNLLVFSGPMRSTDTHACCIPPLSCCGWPESS